MFPSGGLRGAFMHFYQFHIGDYKSHTHHLSHIEDLAFRRLLDYYYLHEVPIKQRNIARQIGMRDYEQEVLSILDEFFESTEKGYINPRADKEIAKYRKFAEDGKKGASIRWSKGGDSPPNGEANSPPNATPIATNNHKPITNNHNKTTVVVAPKGVSDEVWKSFTEQRKKARAIITDLVIDQIRKEADKINWTLEQAMIECVSRGWRGFKADWVKQPINKADIARATVPSTNERDPALVKLDADRKNTAPPPPEIMQKIREVLNK
jgi:uncharacterized protein YdaU (DUF1376 family)